ncbi:MAG: YoaK family protein [bacterium]|nr:YoaK family protein [bacterium]
MVEERTMLGTWKIRKISESIVTAMLLAFAGGYLDIYTYVARGKVFANTQTGNLVLLGANLAEGNTKKIVYYVMSIFFFCAGVALAKVVECKYGEGHDFLWRHITLGIEIAALAAVMFIPNGKNNILANSIISFVCALQIQSFRTVNGNSYSTAMFTGNLKNAAEKLSEYAIHKEKKSLKNGIVYSLVIGMFILGAGVGDLVTRRYRERAVGFIDIVLLAVFILLFFEKKQKE